MKKVIVIFFLCLYVCSATEAGELLRLPLLVQHFFSHKEQDNSITFYRFINLHYDKTDSEDYKDTRLPFKSNDHSAFISNSIAIPPSSSFGLDNPDTKNEIQTVLHKEQFFKSAYLSCIWQPPKSC